MKNNEFSVFDANANDYDEALFNSTKSLVDDISYFAKYKIDLTKNLIKNKSPSRILEYGCGTGRNLLFLKKAFPESTIVAYDISTESLEIAKKENIDIQFISNLDEDIKKFDLIFIAGVFHHIPKEDRVSNMDIIFNLLKKDADLIIFELNPLNPVTKHITKNSYFDKDAELLRAKELLMYTKKHTDKVDVGYTLFIPPKFKSIIFLDKYLKKIPFGGQYYLHAKKL